MEGGNKSIFTLEEAFYEIDQKFTKADAECFDYYGMRRNCLIFNWSEITQDVKFFIRDLLMCRNALPIKRWKILEFNYPAQKRSVTGENKDLTTAAIVVEPINNNLRRYLQRFPISQKLPIGEMFIINHHIPYDLDENGNCPQREFLYSNEVIEYDKDKINKITSHPFLGGFITSQDIGSLLQIKMVVEEIQNSEEQLDLFSFRRFDKDKQFILMMYQCFEMSWIDLFELIKKYINELYKVPQIDEEILDVLDHKNYLFNIDNMNRFIDEILKQLKGKIKNKGNMIN